MDEEDDDEDVESEEKGKVMVTSPDGTIVTCIDKPFLRGP